jgi:hypothetical protein
MSAPYPTKTRIALLRAVADGEVWRYRNEQDYLSEPHRKVTARMAELTAADWVELVEPRSKIARELRYRQWRLTDAGRAVLARAQVSP